MPREVDLRTHYSDAYPETLGPARHRRLSFLTQILEGAGGFSSGVPPPAKEQVKARLHIWRPQLLGQDLRGLGMVTTRQIKEWRSNSSDSLYPKVAIPGRTVRLATHQAVSPLATTKHLLWYPQPLPSLEEPGDHSPQFLHCAPARGGLLQSSWKAKEYPVPIRQGEQAGEASCHPPQLR